MQGFLPSFPFPPSVDRPPYRNGGSVPDSSFHHQKADAVKDKIRIGLKAFNAFDAGLASEFGWPDPGVLHRRWWSRNPAFPCGEVGLHPLAVVYCEHAKKSGMWLISH